jgi:hypothetical protein
MLSFAYDIIYFILFYNFEDKLKDNNPVNPIKELIRIRPDSKHCVKKRQCMYDDAVVKIYEAVVFCGNPKEVFVGTSDKNEEDAIREAYIIALNSLHPCPDKKWIFVL